jgi:hypothetical protein
MGASAKNAPFSLRAETRPTGRERSGHESQAITRDAYIADQQVGWTSGSGRLPVVNRAKRFVGILSIGNVATLASHGTLAKH